MGGGIYILRSIPGTLFFFSLRAWFLRACWAWVDVEILLLIIFHIYLVYIYGRTSACMPGTWYTTTDSIRPIVLQLSERCSLGPEPLCSCDSVMDDANTNLSSITATRRDVDWRLASWVTLKLTAHHHRRRSFLLT